MNILKDLEYNNTSNIKILYHSVFNEESYNFVESFGIVKDKDGFVYLSEKPITDERVVACYEVRIPDNKKLYDWRDFWYEDGEPIDPIDHEYDPDNPYYIYMGNIPSVYLNQIYRRQ